jgi:hypothetical protein
VSRAAAVRVAAVTLLCTLAPPLSGAQNVGLEPSAIADAIRLGRSPSVELEHFHSAYRVTVDDPVVRMVEVVTEFRRIVQLTEERERLRDVTWDSTRAAVAARDWRGRLDLVVELQFSPQNTYRTFPDYSLAIYRRGDATALPPIDIRSAPSYVAAQPAPPGTPILGGRVTATFDAARLDPSRPWLVAVLRDGKEVRRIPVDLGSVR